MGLIEVGQAPELFGQNECPLSFLKKISEKYSEVQEDYEILKKSIEKFNSIGVEIDISIRYKSDEVDISED